MGEWEEPPRKSWMEAIIKLSKSKSSKPALSEDAIWNLWEKAQETKTNRPAIIPDQSTYLAEQ